MPEESDSPERLINQNGDKEENPPETEVPEHEPEDQTSQQEKEHREHIIEEIPPELRVVQEIVGAYKFYDGVRAQFLQEADSETRARYEQHPELLNELLRQRAIDVARVRVPIERVQPREVQPPRESRPGFISIPIETSYGGTRWVEISENDNEKVQWMRGILNSVEATKAPDGGDVNRVSLETAALVISYFRRHPELQKTDLANEMYRELVARLVLHGAFLQFEKAGDADAVSGVVSNLLTDHLNFFFCDSSNLGLAVWGAFKYYEQHSREYLNATLMGPRINLFNRGVRESLAVDSRNIALSEADKISSQTIGEKLWQLTGRRAILDELVVGDNRLGPIATEDQKKDPELGLDFRGENSNGNWVLRRVLRFKDWLSTQKKSLRPQIQLLDGVDLQNMDYFSRLPSQLEDYYTNLLIQKYQVESKENKSKAKTNAKIIVEALLGIQKKTIIDEDGKEVSEWPKNEQLVLTRIKWDGKQDGQLPPQLREFVEKGTLPEEALKIDFSIFNSETPMAYWSYRNMSAPDKVRDPLVASTDSLLRRPSYEAFQKLVNTVSYQSSGQHDTRAKLLENLVKFLRYENKTVFGAQNIPYATANNMIEAAARSNLILRRNVEAVKKGALKWLIFSGNRASRGSRLFFHYFSLWDAITGMIGKIIEAVLKP